MFEFDDMKKKKSKFNCDLWFYDEIEIKVFLAEFIIDAYLMGFFESIGGEILQLCNTIISIFGLRKQQT